MQEQSEETTLGNVDGMIKWWKKSQSLDASWLIKPCGSGHVLQDSFCLSKKGKNPGPKQSFITYLSKIVTSSIVPTYKILVAMRRKDYFE